MPSWPRYTAPGFIKLSLFLMGDLMGDHHDSVVNALIHAHHRGVEVQILFNGHLARQGRIGIERTMHEELNRPLLPAVQQLKSAADDSVPRAWCVLSLSCPSATLNRICTSTPRDGRRTTH